MRVDAFPARATIVPGEPLVVSVQVFNTSPVISAHRVRILGVDPSWVTLDQDQLSLFPDTTGIVVATVTLPAGIPAGTRQLTVQVSETTPPGDVETCTVDLTVTDEQGARIALDPLSVSAGSKTTIAVLLENEGNTELQLRLEGIDEEDNISFAFQPEIVELAPGERVAASVLLKARRPMFGQPKARTYTVRALGTDPPMETFGAFVQRPRLTRGALGLLGLLAAISVFALVISFTLGKVADKSKADRDLLLQVVNGQKAGAVTNPASISGKVSLLTSSTGIAGVTVEAFDAGNTSGTAITTSATDSSGAYKVDGLPAGSYKLRFSGAGFTQIWYVSALTPDNAKALEVQPGQALAGIDIRLGGLPGKITGTVLADNPADAAGATVALTLPSDTAAVVSAANGGAVGGGQTFAGLEAPSSTVPPTTAAASPPASTGANVLTGPAAQEPLVAQAAVGADGTFTLDNVPSPSAYDLTVSKQGFATAVQRVNLAGGEDRKGVNLSLKKGDGLISGHVFDANGPVGGVTITASDGSAISGTVSLTQDDVGGFTLRNLATPGNYTLLFSKDGFTTQTLSLTLSPAQQLTGVVATISGGSGSVEGQVNLSNGSPAGGVSIIVTNGSLTLQTATVSVGNIGSYRLTGLPLPGTYTITFAGPGLASVTQAFDLDPFAQSAATVNAVMPPAAGTVIGTVREQGSNNPVGEVGVTLSSGGSTFHTVSVSAPAQLAGQYRVDNVPPGTYTLTFDRLGAQSVSFIVNVTIDQPVTQDAVVGIPATISGTVYRASDHQPLQGAQVRLFVLSQYPNQSVQTVITDSSGHFSFVNVVAPESYIVEYAFPTGTPAQATRLVNNLGAGEQRDIACAGDGTNVQPDGTTCTGSGAHVELTTG